MASPRERALVSDLASFAAASSVAVPPDLQQRLSADGIDTPAALLRRQRWSPPPGAGAGHPGNAGDGPPLGHDGQLALGRLAAHAALATLDAPPDLRTRLIDAGLLSGAALVEVGRRRVVALAGPDLAAEATRAHSAATTQGKVLDALLTAERLQAAADPATAAATTDCGCPDCRAATSPMAYLADLLGYVRSRVGVGDAADPLLPATLASLLYQPVTDLPVECGSVQDDVSQVRLVVESMERLIATDLRGEPDVACGPRGHSMTFMAAADVDGDRQAELVIGFEPDPSSWLNGGTTPLRAGLWVMRLDRRTGRWGHLRPGADLAGPDGAAFLFPAGMKATSGLALRLRRDPVVRRADRQQVLLTVEQDGVPGTRCWILQYEPEAATDGQAWTHAVPGSFTAFGADLPAGLPDFRIVLAADIDGDGLDEVILCGSAPASGAGDPDHPAAVCAFDFDGQFWTPLCPPGSPYDIAYDVSPGRPYPVKLAAAGDLDRNGRAEIAVVLDGPGSLGKVVSVMGYDPAAGQWNHVSPLGNDPTADADLWPDPWPANALAVGSLAAMNSPELVAAPAALRIRPPGARPDPNRFVVQQFSSAAAGFAEIGTIDCTTQALPADRVVLADVDGDGHDELVVTTQRGRTDTRYAAWVMKRDAAGAWQHLTPVPGHPLDADLVWTGSGQWPARILLAADVNADGADELVIGGGDANAIWVLAYDSASRRWQHLSPVIPADDAEAAYALAAYRSLLQQAGTSYQELRQIAGASAADRAALAQRLGITGDPAALLPAPAQIRMPVLESLFGLPSTRRDPFSDGPTGGADAARVTRWSLSGARWSTDVAAATVARDGRVYLSLVSGAAATLTVIAYRDAARTSPVATGVAAADGTVRLAGLSGSGLTGTLELAGTGEADDLWLQAFPALAVLRWERLRELWNTEDDDGTFAGQVVDPDLIGPDDFRLPLAKAAQADHDRAFDVWLRRRAWADALQVRLRAAGEDLTALFAVMRGTPPAADDPWRAAPDDVAGYLGELAAGLAADPARVTAATTAIGEVLYLPADAFTRLTALRTAASAAPGGPAGPTARDWAEIRAILAVAHKRSRADAWRAEEAAAGIRLDAESFVAGPALTDGEWPPSASPLADPDQVAITDLPVSIAGGRARAMWRRRVIELTGNLAAIRDAGDWTAQLGAALGAPGPDPWPQWVATLAGELDSGDSQVVEAALARLTAATGGMSVTAFRQVAAVNAVVLAGGVVTEQAQADAIRVLADVRKAMVLHPRWRTEESRLAYWQLRRPALPQWLASQQGRQDWLIALAAGTKAPALDPDLVPRDQIRSASAAMPLRDGRAGSLFRLEQDTLRPLLTGPAADPLAGVDGALLAGLWTAADRAAVRADLAAGHTDAPGLLAAAFGTDAGSFAALVTALGAGGDAAADARRAVLLDLGFSAESGFRDVVTVAGTDPQNVTAAQWAAFDTTVADAVLLNVITRAELAADQLGLRVAGRLAPTQLDLAAWRRVLSLRTLAAAGAALQPDEVDDAVALLRRCVKRRASGAWREAERAAGVRIGPDSFTPPPDPGPLPEPAPGAVTAAEQRAWTRVMAARSDQHDQVLPAIRDAARRTETATLPGYRDALLAALPVASGDPAGWAGTHLVVDVADSGERRTTRAAQAIDSILTLLWSLRTGQARASYPQLRLDASDWDAEWRWIGSYATWRSAMLVFLYPENLLRPSLRRLQSPALTDALQAVRDARQLTVGDARQIAADYAQYFADVCRLDLAGLVCATTTAAACPVHLVPGTGQARAVEVYAAVSTASRRVYWTMRDRTPEAAAAGLDLGFWHPLDQFTSGSVSDLVGLDTYVPAGDPAAKRWLYLFAVTQRIGGRDLVFLRYDLDSSAGTWSAEATPLDLPDGVSEFTATVLPTAAGDPPRILLDVPDGDRTDQLVRSLDAKGENWARAEFVSLIGYGGWRELTPAGFATAGLGTVRQVLLGDFDGNHIDEVALISDTGSRMLRVGSNTAWNVMGAPVIRPAALVARGRFTRTDLTESHDDLASIGRITPSRVLLHRYDLLSGTWSVLGDTTAWQLPDETTHQLMLLWATALTAGDFDGSGLDTLALLGTYSSDGTGACAWLLRPSASGFQPVGPDTPLARVRPAARLTAPNERPDEVRIAFHLSATLPGDSPVVPGLAVVADVDGDGRDELVVVCSPTEEVPDRGNDLWIWDWHPELGWGPMARIGAESLTRTVYDLGSDPFSLVDIVAGDFDGDGRDEIACLVDAHDGAPPVVRVLDLTVPPYTADPATDGTWAELPVIDLSQASSPVRFGASADVDGDGADELVLAGDNWLQIRALDRRLRQWAEFPLTGWGLGGPAAFVAAGNLDTANPFAARRRPRRGTRIRGAADQFAVAGGHPDVFTPDPTVLWQQRHPLGVPDGTGIARRFAVTVPGRTPCQPGWVIPAFVDTEGWILDDRVPESHRAARSRQAVTANLGAPAAVRRVVEEAFYDVPAAIALALQSGHDYQHALDWFRLVYDFTRPPGERESFHGLVLDAQGHSPDDDPDPAGYRRVLLEWARDPLDPYAVAAIRPFTHTRGVLQLLIRCLLDAADAEFTQDTAESVERARVLYQAARELLGDPVLHQHLGPCEDVVAQVPPGTPAAARLGQALLDGAELRAGRHQQLLGSGVPLAGLAADGIAAAWAALPSPVFCVSPNPVLLGLRLHAELNLFKLRTGRNISGMRRALDAYAAPTDQSSGLPVIGADGELTVPGLSPLPPTPYRYSALVQQARQLAGQARDVEAMMLAALEKRDAEAQNLLRARQDVRAARAGVRLQELRVTQAQDRVTVAQLQQQRAQLEEEHFQQLLAAGQLQYEREALGWLEAASVFQVASAIASFASAATSLTATAIEDPTFGIGARIGSAASALSSVAGGLGSLASNAATWSSISSLRAGFARTQQDWQLRQQLAGADRAIAGAQVSVETDGVRAAEQEQLIGELNADTAEQLLDFHQNKFTSAELYDWMAGVLDRAYRWFLQQATAMAQLAAAQLAFERQEGAPPAIQADYWEPPGAGGLPALDDPGPDRHGLTGATRLIQDIAELEQYAFGTDQRRQQLTATISLAALDPLALAALRRDGVTTFATPMRLFDAAFPGHYLRLIRRVTVSVIALVSPADGIHATLSASGISRVVTGPDVFSVVVLHRPPESVALTSALGAGGVFTFEPQASGLRDPFEGLGVDTAWEFRLPQAANLFDFTTIADVLVTVDYTALDSDTYRQQVLRELDSSRDGQRGLSLRHEFPDAWWDLVNPDSATDPMRVSVTTTAADFPPNLDELAVQEVAVALVTQAPPPARLGTVTLRFTEDAAAASLGGPAGLVDSVVSTRRGNGGPWLPITGKSPIGRWDLAFPDGEEIRDWLAGGGLLDVLLVVGYAGRTPPWPA